MEIRKLCLCWSVLAVALAAPAVAAPVNVAHLYGSATANQTLYPTTHGPERAIDNNFQTYWVAPDRGTATDPNWLVVDLGGVFVVDSINVFEQAHYGFSPDSRPNWGLILGLSASNGLRLNSGNGGDVAGGGSLIDSLNGQDLNSGNGGDVAGGGSLIGGLNWQDSNSFILVFTMHWSLFHGLNGQDWTPIGSGTFIDVDPTAASAEFVFNPGVAMRYVKYEVNGGFHWQSKVSEIQVWSDQTPPSPVPEPATLLLMGLGMAGLGLMRRRKA